MLGDTVGSLLQCTDPVPATFQSSTSLSINPNKDAEGFPSWWRASLLPGLLDTPIIQVVFLRPILDLRRLNFSLYKRKFKMLTMKTIMSQIQGGDWFVTIDLKDAYFHIQVVQRHRKFLRFAFGRKAYCPSAWPWRREQARPSCLCRYLPQAARPHGSCVAPRVASHEAVPLVDERAEVTPHYTSHLPYQGVAQLLSTPFTMAGPRFSLEQGENGCDPPSPYDHDGRINDGLGSGLRRRTGKRGMDRRVPFLAHKLPGTQGCLPGFDVFTPRSWGASYHSQNGQYGGSVPHKPSGRFTVAHPGQACAPSSPLVPGQVPFFEGSSLCRVKVSSARLLLIAPFWPSQTWFSELTPLLYRPPWEIPIRWDLLSQLQGRIWHPQPELWKLGVWPIQGQRP